MGLIDAMSLPESETVGLPLVLFLATLAAILMSELKATKKKRDAAGLPSLPPGPWGLPVIGNLHQLGSAPHRKLTEWRYKFGDVYKIQMGSWPTIVINGRDAIRQAVVRQAEDFAGRPDFYTFNFISNGKSMGFGDYGARWRLHRRIAQNALALFINNRYTPIEIPILEEAKFLADNLVKNGEEPFDPREEIYLSAGNIICMTCFGKRYKRDDPDFVALIKMNDDFMTYAGAGNPVDVLPWTRHLTKKSFQNFISILRHMDEFCRKKRDEHIQTYVPSHIRDVTDALLKSVDDIDDREKRAVGLTNEHILGTVQEIIAAGFDTIATNLHWAILFMVTHPNIQERVQEEIMSVIGRDRDVRVDDIGRLPYTEACLLETTRYSCVFPFALPHSATRDTTLNGYFIPEKSLVFLNMWSVHHDPEKFAEPYRFDPTRFLDKTGTILNKAAAENFFPFGAGRRRCPGEQLAKVELFIFFTTLLQKCKFRQVEGETYTLDNRFGLTLKPYDFKMRVDALI